MGNAGLNAGFPQNTARQFLPLKIVSLSSTQVTAHRQIQDPTRRKDDERIVIANRPDHGVVAPSPHAHLIRLGYMLPGASDRVVSSVL
jgi:hypothetical protein